MQRTRWSSCLVSLALTVLFLVALAPGARAMTVSVSPADTTVFCADTITVRVVLDEFSNLEAYQLIFGFNPAVLEYLGAEVGGLGDILLPLPDVTSPTDTVWVDCAKLGGSVNGPGILAYFTFTVLGTGSSPITCLKVDLRDSENVPYEPACVGGIVRVPYCPTPALPETWGRIKTLYR